MNKLRLVLLVISLLLIACTSAFGQGLQDREVFAGSPYVEDFRVLCFVGGGSTTNLVGGGETPPNIGEVFLRVQVLPFAFPVTPNPVRVSVGSFFRLRADVPITTKARPYQITILGIGASAAACGSTSETFNLFVRKPVELSVPPATTQVVFPGSTNEIEVGIVRHSNFTGPVNLRAVGLPFAHTFSPQGATGNFSRLRVQVPPTTTECPAPDGCRVEIDGDAFVSDGRVEVQSAEFRLVVLGQVSLTPNRTEATVETGQEAVFNLQVNRIGYPGTVNLDVKPIEQPANGKFTRRITPETLLPEPAFTLGITIDPSAPGTYKFRVKAANTGQDEPFVTLTVTATPASAPSLIQVTPASKTIDIGDSAVFDIIPAEGVTLTDIEVDKAGITGGFDSTRTKLLVQTRPTTPIDTYLLFVRGTVMTETGMQMVESRPVPLTVQPVPGGSVSITGPSNVIEIAPGFRVDVPIGVDPVDGYVGVVELQVPPILDEGVTAQFLGGNSVELGFGMVKTLRLAAPANARPTGEVPVVINSAATPDAPRDTPTIKFKVTEPELTFTLINPPATSGILAFGPIRLKATVNRNGCQSPFIFDYSPRTFFDIVLAPNQDIDTFARARVERSASFDLTVTVMADGCRPASFKLDGVYNPLPTISPLVTATLSPAGQTIQRGQSAAFTFTVNRGSTTGPIAVTVSGLPAGLPSAVAPNPITGSAAQVTLNTTSSSPAGTFPFTVTASSNGSVLASASASLVVVAAAGPTPPTISFFTPASGTAGAPVQITGTNFTGVQNVLFNGVGTPFATISATQINTSVPGFATTGPITVITSGGMATSSTPFLIGASSLTPQITSFSPASGAAGTSVRLNGANLGGVIDVSMGTAAFGFNPIPFTPFDATRVDVSIPSGAPSGFFRVTTPSGTATSGTAFNVTTPNLPEIGGFSPISGPAGTRVLIIGSNLAGATQVTFAGVGASFEPPQQNGIYATVPPGATTGQIRVTTPAGTATSFSSFAVTSGGPVITDFQPQSGQAGFSITIAGANLNATSQVTFNGTPASVGIITPNFVQVFVPGGATTGPIRLVTPNGETTSPTPFTVLP